MIKVKNKQKDKVDIIERHNSFVSSKTAATGITLVALVITIIVLLILAGVSIAMLAGENGILGNAEKAIGKSENAQIQENATLANYEEEIMGARESNNQWTLITTLYECNSEKVTVDFSKYKEIEIRACNKERNWIWGNTNLRVRELSEEKPLGAWVSFMYSTSNYVTAQINLTPTSVSWEQYEHVASVIEAIEIFAR